MTSNFLKNDNFEIANKDCFEYIKTLKENSIDLIIIDPPYYNYLDNDWDNQWKNLEHYLAWLDSFFEECYRVLSPNGSFYCFCSNRHTAEIELIIKKYFNFLNHIIWKKTHGRFNAHNKERLRSYACATERILFAEHKSNNKSHKSQKNVPFKLDEIRGQCFKPLIEYFINAKNALDITEADIKQATNTKMYKHWFTYSQWYLPSEQRFNQIYRYFDKVATKKGIDNPLSLNIKVSINNYEVLSGNYEKLKMTYNELKEQYNNHRRYFRVTKDVPFTDVWEFSPVQYYKDKHPCEKPSALIEHIITASSHEGQTVADFFAGSGSTLQASIKLERKFKGCEVDQIYFNHIVSKVDPKK